MVAMTRKRPIPEEPEELPEESLFDDSAGYEEDGGVRLAPSLSADDIKWARTLYHLFNELWGVIAVVGAPGAGKDTFGNYLAYTLQRFFPHKRILRDEKPRELFGPYAGLFNPTVLSDDLKRMREVAKGVGARRLDDVMQKAADEWAAGKGRVLLQNSVLYLTEYWRYCYKRNPHEPMNKTMGGIHKLKRHLNTLIIGTVQQVSDLDRFTCLPFIDWRVTCTRSRLDTTKYTFFVEKVKYDDRMDMLVVTSRAFPIPVDAGKPRSFMGDGKIVLRKPDYLPETLEEKLILNYVKAGVSSYEDLTMLMEADADIPEWQTLRTLKKLALKLPGERPKFVLWYPCVYFLFNSRSAPQLTTTLKGSE